ncbi:hypothetical protein J4Q44_G00093490 [Coregonus suidteri]|uniref:Uncharacterized protein n=1 Tax=Coregonus suidteri TaxID=861788 RepID=A0AAN8RAZ5_9TELE
MVSHVTASLKKIFPDSSPRKILKKIPPDLQERLWNLATRVDEHLSGTLGPCGGISETNAALCDFNEFPCREEVQWDVDNIYYAQNGLEFNFLDFSLLENRDLALSVDALSFNPWFTKLSSKDLKLSSEVQEQVLFMINRSSTLEEVCLEGGGVKLPFSCRNFAVKMACGLRDHTCSAIHTINLSANHIEDKGVIALSQELENPMVSPSCPSPGLLSLPKNLFKFLSGTNAVSYLDLSGTDCPLDALFVSLSAGFCSNLAHLNLSRNPSSHRKVREVTRTVIYFFSKSSELKYVGLAGTKLPPEALRCALMECHTRKCFESDIVTLVLSIGCRHSIRDLALGCNFAMKSRALTDVLQRIVQLMQEEECPLESLSVCDSELKTGTTILINSLGRNASLTNIDTNGNCIKDTGANLLAKALLINTKLRTLVWDRNNVTVKGFLDVANVPESHEHRNFTLQHMSIPMSDVTHGYCSSPEKTEEALQKIQACLLRNNQRQSGVPDQILNLQQGLKTVRSLNRSWPRPFYRQPRLSIPGQTALFIQDTLIQHTGELSELKLSVSVSLVESIIDEVLQDLSVAQQELDRNLREQTSSLSYEL